MQINGTLSCAPPATYSGPCRGEDSFDYPLGRDTASPSYLKLISTDFTSYNAAMLELWSAQCDAYWPCAGASFSRQSGRLRAAAPQTK